MKRLTFSIVLLVITALFSYSASVTFTGNNKPVITEKPSASTGLNDLFVLSDVKGVSVQYKSSSSITWYRYSNLGGGYAEVVPATKQGDVYTLSNLEGDMGYYIEEGTNRYYFWVVDYSKHYLDIETLNIASEQECDVTTLNPIGYGDVIRYYTINGQAKELDRDIKIAYNTLQWNDGAGIYNQVEVVETFAHLNESMRVQAPLCNTEFTITGDRFLETWGESTSVTSQYYTAIAVDAHTLANQTIRENDNEKKDEATLGGSAPVEIEFSAVGSDAVVFNEWQFATDAEFENITLRMNELVVTHVFREQGTTYVRFVASNDAGTCDYYSDTYEVFIGASSIDCPNAFSPDASEGINDEWKVSYKSIISFECYIFNRWGIKVAEFYDPSQGWDGKHNGKYVPAGVYYYVIKAEGADGRTYDLKGDINIIKYKYSGSSATAPTE